MKYPNIPTAMKATGLKWNDFMAVLRAYGISTNMDQWDDATRERAMNLVERTADSYIETMKKVQATREGLRKMQGGP